MPKKGVEMESGVVEGGRSPRGRKWARARVREGGRGGRKEKRQWGKIPGGENIHTSIHVRCVAWLCRCVLDLVAANAAHLLCPWWMSLSGAVQRVGWPAACERQAADRQTRTGSQGRYLLCREVLRSCPASCQLPATRPRATRATRISSTKGCLGPIQSARPSLIQPRVSLVPCRTSPDDQGDRRRGDLWNSFSISMHWASLGCPWMDAMLLLQAGISSGLSGIRSFKLP